MMRIKLVLAATVTLAAMSAAPASAVTTFTTNFDSVSFAAGSHIVSSIEGWNGGPLGIEVQSGGLLGTAKSGSNLVELDTTGNSSMSRALDAGIYTLSFAYSARPGASVATDGIGLYVGNTLVRSITSSGTDRNGNPKANTSWLTVTATFTAAHATQLKFAALGTSDGIGGYLDNITLTGTALPPVPEPGEWAMLAAGLGVIGAVARRRRAI